MMLRRPEALLFDAGGTLVHMSPEAAADALVPIIGEGPGIEAIVEAHHRATAELSARRALATRPSEEWWPWWVRRFLEVAGVVASAEAVAAVAALHGVWTAPVPGSHEALTRLTTSGYRLAVVSNADGTVRAGLDDAGLVGFFEIVIDSHEVGVSKPDPRIFHIALDHLGVSPDAAWYVGDSVFHDVEGAAAAGLATTVLVDPLFLEPDYRPRVASVTELPAMLAGLPE